MSQCNKERQYYRLWYQEINEASITVRYRNANALGVQNIQSRQAFASVPLATHVGHFVSA